MNNDERDSDSLRDILGGTTTILQHLVLQNEKKGDRDRSSGSLLPTKIPDTFTVTDVRTFHYEVGAYGLSSLETKLRFHCGVVGPKSRARPQFDAFWEFLELYFDDACPTQMAPKQLAIAERLHRELRCAADGQNPTAVNALLLKEDHGTDLLGATLAKLNSPSKPAREHDRKRAESPRDKATKRHCYYCGATGHMAYTCEKRIKDGAKVPKTDISKKPSDPPTVSRRTGNGTGPKDE